MSRRSLHTVAVLLLLAGSATAQEELIETKWTVNEKGEVLVHPHHYNTPEENANGVGRPLFCIAGDGENLGEVYLHGGILGLVRFAFPGPVDLASHCDIENHFRKLGLGLTDEEIIRRIGRSPSAASKSPHLRRRASLDQLLAIRLAARRKLALAEPALRAILNNGANDRFVLRAAWDALAELGADLPYPFERHVPPLLPVLAEIPDSADLVIVVNQSRCPRWEGVPALAREWGMAQAREVIDQLGAAVKPRDLLAGQWAIDIGGESPYELARLLGNMLVHRSVVAFDLQREGAVRIRLDGLFDAPRIREFLEDLEAECKVDGDHVVCTPPGGGWTIEVSPRRFELVLGEWTGVPGGPLLATELGLAGATRGEAVWAHFRTPSLPDEVGPLRGLASGTLTISFEKGISLHLDAEYVHAAAARTAGGALRELLEQALEEVGLATPKVSFSGVTLSLDLRARGESAEDVFRRFLRVR